MAAMSARTAAAEAAEAYAHTDVDRRRSRTWINHFHGRRPALRRR